ncbi:uncharacterized protein FIBRA_00107 [Fibroporia radiculosa]|uniref:Aminoglycoside phosphotransferase domain-containing protein n=1 Tax=Fibroporia radiculosa TaxID=599839 RepID=J7SCG6_9APHY|nr:uncharacterized protein FIBRA_00107 [Fibroporia radiculosa]CCL98113.1 predicted protein [Fibroporia radiculosa]
MSSSTDLSTATGILTYIADTPFDSDTAVPITGGFGNYVFRLHLRTPLHEQDTVVFKHAKPYVPGWPTMAISLDRQVYEVAALRQVRERLPDTSLVTVPEVILFDDVAHVIIMNDCGERALNLKQLLQSSPPPDTIARQIGTALGEFLAWLHNRGSTDEEFLDFFARNEKGKLLSADVTYGRLVSTLTDAAPPLLAEPPLEVPREKLDIIGTVANDTWRAMQSTTETVVMGDFWPGNVLVALQYNEEGIATAIERIVVVDWELAKSGLAGLDVGQFSAELHLLRSFHPASNDAASALLTSFLEAYRRTCDGDALTRKHVAKIALVHIGAHLVAWTPRVPWGNKEKVRELVQRGIDYLVEGSYASEGYIRDSMIAALLR